MKTISNELAAHLAGEVTTVATCWKLTRKDATVMGFTDHNENILYEGVTYVAATGFNPSAIANNANLGADNLDVEGMLSSQGIEEADVLAGKYDSAEIEIFKINYADHSQGILKLKKGWLGEVILRNHQFVAEVRGVTQKLTQNIGELYSPSCRATLGDVRCKVSMAAHTYTGAVTSSANRQEFYDTTLTEDSGLFSFGTVTFTSGANAGLSMEIKEHIYSSTTGAKVTLTLPMPYTITAADSYFITSGCDKTLATCKAKFDNVANFRGEPHVPGIDKILETAGTRSG